MRLWHYKLIPYLPNSQLIAQWRELNSIFKNQNRHILINYVYTYPKDYLWNYSLDVLRELDNRHISIRSNTNYTNYFGQTLTHGQLMIMKNLHFREHDDDYLTICYYNLKEKYIRAQRDFSSEEWNRLKNFYEEGGI